MKKELEIIKLRLLVGFLGEKSQFNWWPSNFFSDLSSSFLEPIFPKTSELARVQGVTQAGRLLHDERIGVGRVFHLFRLPETMEQILFEKIRDQSLPIAITQAIESRESAMVELERQATAGMSFREGPVQIGYVTDLVTDDWLGTAAAYYHAAFSKDAQVFPYLVEAE